MSDFYQIAVKSNVAGFILEMPSLHGEAYRDPWPLLHFWLIFFLQVFLQYVDQHITVCGMAEGAQAPPSSGVILVKCSNSR